MNNVWMILYLNEVSKHSSDRPAQPWEVAVMLSLTVVVLGVVVWFWWKAR